MSGLRDDDGRRPHDPDGLPDLPEDWGRIVIPDDASELAREAARVRRELRREALLRRYRLRASRHHLALPLVVLALAMLVTTTSLFAAVWPPGQRPTEEKATPASAGPATPAAKTVKAGAPLPDLTLTDSTGSSVRLGTAAKPGVILLLRACGCAGLVSGTVAATAKTGVPVLVVGGRSLPAVPSLPANAKVTTLTDPAGALAAAVAGGLPHRPSDGDASAVLVNRDGSVRQLVPDTTSAANFTGMVGQLA